jgi:Flp pilus assembly protein TadG
MAEQGVGTRWARRCRYRNDDGSVSVEAAVLLPVLLVIFLATVQLGTILYARAVASSAARQGLDAARVVDGSEAAGTSAARQFLVHVSSGLRNPTIAVDRGAEEVTVTVDAGVLSLVPGWRPEVSVTVSAPVERTVE